MQFLSLHVKLRHMLEVGVLSLRQDLDLGHVLPGEGSYYYGNDKVDVIANYTGKLPGLPLDSLSIPHDVAWVERTKTMLAYAPSETGPFTQMPDELKKLVSDFKKKSMNYVN